MGDMADDINERGERDYYEQLFEEEQYKEVQKLKTNKLKINVMAKSKVEKIVGEPKEWNGNGNGTIYYHNLEMENGDKINIGKKKVLVIGDELEYEIVDQDGSSEYQKAKTPKPENTQSFSGGKSDDYVKGIEVGHAINNSVNLICAGAELGIKECATTEEKIYESAKVIMAIADRLKSER